ncbi:protein kinase domain-containing protein [Pseudarthrobacter sp. J1763]|uniref:serine/threonine-protein kinase n=1 Tax=Pseudarthrobacter sp. J1763 TaxID=3420445 RepID=UPI003D26DD47
MSLKRPAAPPPAIAGYQFISVLGSGGFSDVYLYQQDRPRRKVAVKVLLSDLKTEGARRRFESEANLMAQLSSHPYIVTIYEAEVTDEGHSYLAMEYCSRPSLDVRYRRQRFSVDEVLAVGIQVSSAVETAHRAGIAHRDIKPANILVTDYNRPALTDFGISGTLGADQDDDAGMSIPWSPPEQFVDGPVDGVQVDVWALGATLYTLLAGRSPFVLPGADNSQGQLISRISTAPVPRLGRADVPESLELALATAMAKNPASRYSSAHAFALALQRIQAELNLSVTPFEVLEEASQEEQHPDDGLEETRVRSIASIDPDAGNSSRTFPARIQGPQAPTESNTAPGKESDDWSQRTMLRGSVGAQTPPSQSSYELQGQPGQAASPDATAPATSFRSSAFNQTPPGSREDLGPEVEATMARPAPTTQPAEVTEIDEAQLLRTRKRNRWLAIISAAVLVIAVVVGIVLGSTAPAPKAQPNETVSKPPADPLDNATVPDVAGLKGAPAAGGKVLFTWKNPAPKNGDVFKWRTLTATGAGEYANVKTPSITVKANPGAPTCIQVIIVRTDGQGSPEGDDSKKCYPQ